MNHTGRLVITGSSSGIGRMLAQGFVADGWQVWGLARRAQRDVPDGGFRHSVCDVANWKSVQAAADEVAACWGTVDALLCCAGAQGAIGPAMAVAPEAWTRTVHVNLNGTFHTVAAFHRLIGRTARRAKVVCFSGGGATYPRPGFSAYGVAKAGIVRLVETLAHEWQGLPVDINAVAPGALPTAMTEETLALGPEKAGAAEYASAQRAMAAGEAGFSKVLALVKFLCSEESDGITGRLLSAPWDPWPALVARRAELAASDIYTLRRIVPEDRGAKW